MSTSKMQVFIIAKTTHLSGETQFALFTGWILFDFAVVIALNLKKTI